MLGDGEAAGECVGDAGRTAAKEVAVLAILTCVSEADEHPLSATAVAATTTTIAGPMNL